MNNQIWFLVIELVAAVVISTIFYLIGVGKKVVRERKQAALTSLIQILEKRIAMNHPKLTNTEIIVLIEAKEREYNLKSKSLIDFSNIRHELLPRIIDNEFIPDPKKASLIQEINEMFSEAATFIPLDNVFQSSFKFLLATVRRIQYSFNSAFYTTLLIVITAASLGKMIDPLAIFIIFILSNLTTLILSKWFGR